MLNGHCSAALAPLRHPSPPPQAVDLAAAAETDVAAVETVAGVVAEIVAAVETVAVVGAAEIAAEVVEAAADVAGAVPSGAAAVIASVAAGGVAAANAAVVAASAAVVEMDFGVVASVGVVSGVAASADGFVAEMKSLQNNCEWFPDLDFKKIKIKIYINTYIYKKRKVS